MQFFTAFRVFLVVLCFHLVQSRRKAIPAPNVRLVPPQPSQYSTSMTINGRLTKYYADTTLHRDRIDYLTENNTMIIDYQHATQYVIAYGSCTRSSIPGHIKPILSFPTYTFNGNLTHNGTLCNEWTGCHEYEIPPAPFNYYASAKENVPIDLILATIGVSIHFSDFTFGPPPSSLFDIPNNCTTTKYNVHFHPVSSATNFVQNGINIFC